MGMKVSESAMFAILKAKNSFLPGKPASKDIILSLYM
jgi:hypothetical protein